MKKIFYLLLSLSCAANSLAQTDFREPLNELTATQKADRALALVGDYNAMRNLAFSYSASGGGAKSKIAGCAWYILVPVVNKQKFNAGDTGNIAVYCNKLSPTDFEVAYDYAFRKLALTPR